MQSKIRCKIANKHCGFVEDVEIRNFIFMLILLGERAVAVKWDLYACFLDYTKALEK